MEWVGTPSIPHGWLAAILSQGNNVGIQNSVIHNDEKPGAQAGLSTTSLILMLGSCSSVLQAVKSIATPLITRFAQIHCLK